MSNKYYRGLRNSLRDTKYKLQLASMTLTSIGAKSSFSRTTVVKVVDQLELFNHSLH